MGWIKDKGGSKKFQLGGSVSPRVPGVMPPRVPGVMPQAPMYEKGGEVFDEEEAKAYKKAIYKEEEKEWLRHPDDLERIDKTKQEILERKKRKEPKAKRSSKYSAKQLAVLSKKHNKTVKEIKRLIDRGPKFGK